MEIKSERLSVKLLPADKAALVQIARAEGEAIAVVVRKLIRSRAKELGISRSEETRRA
jgi:hypothetical protein